LDAGYWSWTNTIQDRFSNPLLESSKNVKMENST
jgi:hypothetical protein